MFQSPPGIIRDSCESMNYTNKTNNIKKCQKYKMNKRWSNCRRCFVVAPWSTVYRKLVLVTVSCIVLCALAWPRMMSKTGLYMKLWVLFRDTHFLVSLLKKKIHYYYKKNRSYNRDPNCLQNQEF
jgi:hypothetical protein